MRANNIRWSGALLLLPFRLWAAEPVAPPAEAAEPPTLVAFDLRGANLREIVRANAASQSGASSTNADVGSLRDAPAAPGPARDEVDAVTAQNDKLRQIEFLPAARARPTRTSAPPLDPWQDRLLNQGSLSAEEAYDAWLSCQDTNDLMTTYQRAEHCPRLRMQEDESDGWPDLLFDLVMGAVRDERAD